MASIRDQELAFKRAIEAHAREYFSHASAREFELSLRETLAAHGAMASDDVAGDRTKSGLEAHVVKRLICAALDRGARERELVSQVFCELHSSAALDADDFERGFDRVLAEVADLKLDFPQALEECGTFLARAVADDVVSVTYLEQACARDGYGQGAEVARKVKVTLEDPGGEARVRNAWGGPEGHNASNARTEMRKIIDEYLISGDGAEAERRLRTLNMPFYHHELVKKALNLAMVQSILTPNIVEKIIKLLKYLGRSSFVNGSQMAKGFARTATTLKDLSLDVPKAPEVFSDLVARAKSAGLLPTGLSAWASLKPVAAAGAGRGRGHSQLLRLDSAPDLAALAKATRSPPHSRSASPTPLQSMRGLRLQRKTTTGLTRMGSATKKPVNAGWNGLRAQTTNGERPRVQGVHVDAKDVLTTKISNYNVSYLLGGRANHKPEGATKSKKGLPRSNSAPGGLKELDTSRFVRPVGKVHDYMPFNEKYELLDVLGAGGFAVVRKARHLTTGEIVAVKSLRASGAGGDSDEESGDESSSDEDSDDEDDGVRKMATMTMREIKRELVMMQQLSEHPHIVTIREFFTEQNDEVVHVVMDVLTGEELEDYLNEHGQFSEDDCRTVIGAMLDAVAFMHSKGVIHRDLKLENFVLKEKSKLESVNVVDFGLAKALSARQQAQHVCGTLSYVAPEALLAGVYGQGVDVWALGVAMHLLLTNEWPFDDDDEDILIELITEAYIDFTDPMWADVSDTAKDLLQGLLEPNPRRRLTAAQALEHAWFTGQKSHTSDTLHRTHARLDGLISVSRQPPERRFKSGDYITRQGETISEFFIIKSGECELTRDGEVVGARRVGNFVGELRSLEANAAADADTKVVSWTSACAVGAVRALVFEANVVEWATQFDYRLSSEFENALRQQRRAVAKEAREERKRAMLAARERSTSELVLRESAEEETNKTTHL